MRWLVRWFGGGNDPIGRRGERLAATWLRRQGYRILERNLPLVDDEADLVALDPDGRTIVVIEVKTRSTDHVPPELGINRTKQFRLARLASRLQRRAAYKDRPFRFDAIAIIWAPSSQPIVRHYAAAFESPW